MYTSSSDRLGTLCYCLCRRSAQVGSAVASLKRENIYRFSGSSQHCSDGLGPRSPYLWSKARLRTDIAHLQHHLSLRSCVRTYALRNCSSVTSPLSFFHQCSRRISESWLLHRHDNALEPAWRPSACSLHVRGGSLTLLLWRYATAFPNAKSLELLSPTNNNTNINSS